MKSELEGSIKSRLFFPLDIFEFQQQRNKWWPSILLNAFNRDFSQGCQLQFLRSFIIRHFSFSWELILLLFLILVTGLIWTLCCFIANHKHKENILPFHFSYPSVSTFSVHLEIQNYKFYLTNSLVETLYFSVPKPTHSLVTVPLGYWKALLSLLHYF